MNQLDVHILKSRDQDPATVTDRKRDLHISTVACSNVVASFPLGSRESITRTCSNWDNISVCESHSTYGGQLTSILRSSMALVSLRASRRAARAEYSMLKGRPVLPSLNSLIALVESSLGSF